MINSKWLADLTVGAIDGALQQQLPVGDGSSVADDYIVENAIEAKDGSFEFLIGIEGKSFLVSVIDLDTTDEQGN